MYVMHVYGDPQEMGWCIQSGVAGLTLPYLLQLRYVTSLIHVYYVVGATLLPFDKIAAEDS
jgi:hypothetical protein